MPAVEAFSGETASVVTADVSYGADELVSMAVAAVVQLSRQAFALAENISDCMQDPRLETDGGVLQTRLR